MPTPQFRDLTEAELKQAFLTKHQEQLSTDRKFANSFFSWFRRTKIQNPDQLSLKEIIRHALYDRTPSFQRNRSHQVLMKLEWFKNPEATVIEGNLVLKKIVGEVKQEHAAELERQRQQIAQNPLVHHNLPHGM